MATVTGSVVAEGQLKFYDGGTSCASPGTQVGTNQTVNGGGQAQVTISALTSGGHTIRACYQGTSNYAASGNSLTQTVNKADANIAVTGYHVTYDGNVHTATGIGSENLNACLGL